MWPSLVRSTTDWSFSESIQTTDWSLSESIQTTDWLLSELIQPDSLISDKKKIELNSAHYGLVD